MSLNKVMLIGNCGRDPEIRHLDTGSVVATFSLATTEKYRDKAGDIKEQTEWHNIVCWRNLAEIAEKYVKKGTPLYVEGRLRTRSYTDKDGIMRYTTEIVADNFQMLGRKSDNMAPGAASAQVSYPQASRPAAPAQQPAPARSFSPVQPAAEADSDTEEDDLPF